MGLPLGGSTQILYPPSTVYKKTKRPKEIKMQDNTPKFIGRIRNTAEAQKVLGLIMNRYSQAMEGRHEGQVNQAGYFQAIHIWNEENKLKEHLRGEAWRTFHINEAFRQGRRLNLSPSESLVFDVADGNDNYKNAYTYLWIFCNGYRLELYGRIAKGIKEVDIEVDATALKKPNKKQSINETLLKRIFTPKTPKKYSRHIIYIAGGTDNKGMKHIYAGKTYVADNETAEQAASRRLEQHMGDNDGIGKIFNKFPQTRYLSVKEWMEDKPADEIRIIECGYINWIEGLQKQYSNINCINTTNNFRSIKPRKTNARPKHKKVKVEELAKRQRYEARNRRDWDKIKARLQTLIGTGLRYEDICKDMELMMAAGYIEAPLKGLTKANISNWRTRLGI